MRTAWFHNVIFIMVETQNWWFY